jgi:hypothetical protein
MKLALQYLNDSEGHTNALQVSITEWNKLMAMMERYELALKLKKSLEEADKETNLMSKSKQPRQTLQEFLEYQ